MQLEHYNAKLLKQALPYPAQDANKYSRGKLTLIAGSSQYPGAACLASAAAMRSGAGYVECCCAPETVPVVQSFMPSVVAQPWNLVCNQPDNTQATLIGCGMYASDIHQQDLLSSAISHCKHPLVIDGGALRILADLNLTKELERRFAAGFSTILTPHGGEAAALASATNLTIPRAGATLDDQASFAQCLANAWHSTVLLKGPVSLIATAKVQGNPSVYIMDSGTPALAKAGTGDVLAGIVGALLAQGVDPQTACVLGATVHAHAARVAARTLGIISVCAEDVLASIPQGILEL